MDKYFGIVANDECHCCKSTWHPNKGLRGRFVTLTKLKPLCCYRMTDEFYKALTLAWCLFAVIFSMFYIPGLRRISYSYTFCWIWSLTCFAIFSSLSLCTSCSCQLSPMCGPNQTSRTSAKEAFAWVGETSAHAAAASAGKPRTAARACVSKSRCSTKRVWS